MPFRINLTSNQKNNARIMFPDPKTIGTSLYDLKIVPYKRLNN